MFAGTGADFKKRFYLRDRKPQDKRKPVAWAQAANTLHLGDIPDGEAVRFKALLAKADPQRELVVYVDSNGGSVFDGFSIYDAVKEYPGKTRAVVSSRAFSIASFIAMAFDTVEVAGNGYFMIHNPQCDTTGDSHTLASGAAMLAKLRETMISAYASRTKLPRHEVESMLNSETYLNAEEAIRYGFANQLTQVPRAVASANPFNATAKWRSAVEAELSRGLPRAKAMMIANRKHPGLRAAYLIEQNR